MIISRLNGGLGNQMFQYAAAKALSCHHQVPLFMDDSQFRREVISELEVPRVTEIFNFPAITDPLLDPEKLEFFRRAAGSRIQKILPRHKRIVYKEPFYHFDRNFFKSRKTTMLSGGWQSFRYFEPFRDIISKKFVFRKDLVERVTPKSLILSSENSVAVHIRRNDYLRMQIILEWHGVMPVQYYRKAITLVRERAGNIKIYYFTDDPHWVKDNLIPEFGGTLISSEESKTQYEDFELMSSCRHNIIANSSFSWWAAYLNGYPEKLVVGPKKWFDQGPQDTQDLMPATWFRI